MNDFKQQLAPGWTPVNIGICVLLYLIFWPLALIMLAYIIWGARFGLDLSRPDTIGVFARRLKSAWKAAVAAFNSRD